VGYGPFFLCVIHKEGLCSSSGDINGLMMSDSLILFQYTILSFIFMQMAYLHCSVERNLCGMCIGNANSMGMCVSGGSIKRISHTLIHKQREGQN
jgi:hypothetical protein